MSANEPTDDELDREAARDVPLAYGGTSRHSPKLSNEPRGINLQDMRPIMQAEREAAEQRQGFVGVDRSEPRHFPQPQPNPVVQLVRTPYRQPQPPPDVAGAEVWDRYVVAALAISGVTASACAAADALLAERRRRFG